MEFALSQNAIGLKKLLLLLHDLLLAISAKATQLVLGINELLLLVVKAFALLHQLTDSLGEGLLLCIELFGVHWARSEVPLRNQVEWISLHSCWQEEDKEDPSNHGHDTNHEDTEIDPDLNIHFFPIADRIEWSDHLSSWHERVHVVVEV